ncbi:MAG: TIGR00269 family protein [Nanoarchaeota archaeon]|nr:TIGR00269 family protein [Nanoarchaeota archaeon]
MRRCSICKKEAFTRVEYMRKNYCKEHFAEFIESKVKNTIEKFKMVREGDKILVAVSGGKDSLTTLHLLHKLFSDKVSAIHLKLGIGKFSEESERIVREFCEKENVNLIIYDLKDELGFSISDLKGERVCGMCGTIKRYLLNKIAYERGFNKIAVGHNLDDELSFVLNSIMSGDLHQLSRIGPITETNGKLIGRIKPLYKCYEKEVKLYCEAVGIKTVTLECPNSKETKQRVYKKALDLIEEKSPGTKLTFISSFLKKIKPILPKSEIKLNECKVCGFPTTSEVCSFCKIVERMKK